MKSESFGKIKEVINENLISNRKQVLKVLAVLVVIIAAVFIRVANNNRDSVEIDTVETGKKSTQIESCIYVDISGEVKNPGIYKLDSQTRLYELIDKAGGLTKHADIDQINQAESIEDGQKIIIPTEATSENSDNASAEQTLNGKININTASETELMELPGVGAAIASRIVEYRGGSRFRTIEDLKNVSGIGDKTFEKMKDLIQI